MKLSRMTSVLGDDLS